MHQRWYTSSRGRKGPRDSFLALLPFLSYELVHLLVQRNNGMLVFYHTTEVASRLTRDGKGAWVQDSLSRRDSDTLKRMVNFPAPDDLRGLLDFTNPIMMDSLLVSVQVPLNNIKAAREALQRIGPRELLKAQE